MSTLYEVPVYCSRLKEWRVLNLTTGVVYSMAFSTEQAAADYISDGEVLGGLLFRKVCCGELVKLLEASEVSRIVRV